MKKLLLSVAALGYFVSAQAQWTFSGSNIHNTNTGNVGVGTTAPASKLHVSHALTTHAPIVSFGDASDSRRFAFFNDLGTAGNEATMEIRTSKAKIKSSRLEFVTNLGTAMFMEFNGHIGVGTLNPGTYRLAVEGKLGAREIVVTTAPWADYVFASNYKLRPLSEVARFIEENKHLPEVPTAAEVAENGNRLAETDALLLKKIEELTLYMIEQNKQLLELKEENKGLKKEIDLLNKK